MKQVSWARLFALSSFGFAITLVSNTLDPAVFGHKVLQLAPEQPNTLLGFSTFAASMLAFVMGPAIGAYSDRAQHSRGSRIIFFLIGVPVLIGALLTIALAPSMTVFVAGVLLFRIGDNIIFPPFQALYPDFVPSSQRGVAAGVKSLLDILALLIGRFSAGELMALSPQIGEQATLFAVLIPISGLIAALLITILGTRDLAPQASRDVPTDRPHRSDLRAIFRMDWKARPAFTWWFINRALFWAGFTILGTFLLFFIIDVVGLVEADAQRYLARLSLVLGGAILLISVPAGRMADRWGRKPLVLWACALTALGACLLLVLRDLNALWVAGGLVGLGAGIFISADFALLTEIVPADEAGRYLGISNIASAGGGAVARLLGGLVIDPLNALTGVQSFGYLSLYALAALLFILSIGAARQLPNGEGPATSEESD